jgi:hypothetical protein
VHALEVSAVSFCTGTIGQKINVVREAYWARPERWVLAYLEEVGVVESQNSNIRLGQAVEEKDVQDCRKGANIKGF